MVEIQGWKCPLPAIILISIINLTSGKMENSGAIQNVDSLPPLGTTEFLDSVHDHVVYQKLENTTFRKLNLFPSSGDWG
jgi:hypothetical protein